MVEGANRKARRGFDLAAALTLEQAQLQAIQQRAPGWTTSKKAHAQWEQQVARRNLEWTSPVDELRKLLNPPSGDYIETNVIKD